MSERRWIAATLLPAFLLAPVALLAPRLSGGMLLVLVGGLFAFFCVGAEVVAASAWAPPLSRRGWLGLLFPLALLAGVAALGASIPKLAAAMIVTACLLGAGSRVGASIGHAIAAPGHLAVVAIVSALVDAFSVLHPRGPTAQLVEMETALSVLALPWPILGTPLIEPVLGVGDVVFGGLYMAAARRHRLPLGRTAAALAIGLALAFGMTLLTRRGIPALPFIGAAVVLAHPEARRLPPTDRVPAAIGIGVLVLLFVVLFLLRAA